MKNLYRIAIQYYGEGTVENVNKLKQANGLSSNNILIVKINNPTQLSYH